MTVVSKYGKQIHFKAWQFLEMGMFYNTSLLTQTGLRYTGIRYLYKLRVAQYFCGIYRLLWLILSSVLCIVRTVKEKLFPFLLLLFCFFSFYFYFLLFSSFHLFHFSLVYCSFSCCKLGVLEWRPRALVGNFISTSQQEKNLKTCVGVLETIDVFQIHPVVHERIDNIEGKENLFGCRFIFN